MYALSIALLKACQIDPTTVTALTYRHRIGELPTLEIETPVTNADPSAVKAISTTYELRERP